MIENGKIIKETRGMNNTDVRSAMRFENQDVFMQYCISLEKLKNEDKDNLPQSLGICTLSLLEKKADIELDSIGSKAQSESEFRVMYQSLVEKYRSHLIRNYIDNTDLTLYAPVENKEDDNMKHIVNIYGEYVIGNKVYSVDSKDLPHGVQMLSVNSVQPYSDEVPENQITFSPAKDKKVSFLIEKDKNNDVAVSMWVKKKLWYGWKADNYRWLLFQPELVNYTPTASPKNNVFWYKGHSDVYQKIGEGLPLQMPAVNPPTVTGKVYIWTDYAFDYDSNGNPVYSLDNPTYPRIARDRAVVVKVNL